MADRYWKTYENMGYVGTDTEVVVDVCEEFAWSKEDLTGFSNEKVEKELSNYLFEIAQEKIKVYAEPTTKKDYDNERRKINTGC